jgi:hypothetical protein
MKMTRGRRVKNRRRNKKENRIKKLQKERKKELEVEVEVGVEVEVEWLLSEDGSGRFLRDLGGCSLAVKAGYTKRWMILRRGGRVLPSEPCATLNGLHPDVVTFTVRYERVVLSQILHLL